MMILKFGLLAILVGKYYFPLDKACEIYFYDFWICTKKINNAHTKSTQKPIHLPDTLFLILIIKANHFTKNDLKSERFTSLNAHELWIFLWKTSHF